MSTKIVPVEPTEEMISAAMKASNWTWAKASPVEDADRVNRNYKTFWRNAYAAILKEGALVPAPSPPAPAGARAEAMAIVARWREFGDFDVFEVTRPGHIKYPARHALADAIASALTAARQAGKDEAREVLASWMMSHSYATGHGDTTEMLLGELLIEIDDCVKRARQAGLEEAAKMVEWTFRDKKRIRQRYLSRRGET